MRFFIEVKLLFEYLLHFGFGLVPGFRFFLSNAVYWNIFPSTLVAGTGDALGCGWVAAGRRTVCVAGVALGDMDRHFAWQAWHLVTWTFTLRGRRGTF